MEDLADIVKRARDGDARAFAEIVARFRNMAFGYAYSRLEDFQLAEDVAQEAFFEAYRLLGSLREPAAFASWFKKVVHKHSDRVWRKPRLDPLVCDDATSQVRRYVPDDLEARDSVRHALNSLPAGLRAVVSLYYIDDHSQAEIADFLGLPVTTVKKRLHDARTRMKESLMNELHNGLHANALDDRFSRRVIDRLRAEPNLISMEGHPVREIRSSIIKALPDYEVIPAEDVLDVADATNPWSLQYAYHPDERHVLCTDLLDITFREMRSRRTPMKVMTFGRLFYHEAEHMKKMPVTHSFSALCIAPGAARKDLEDTVKRVLGSCIRPVVLTYEDWSFKWFDPCLRALLKVNDEWKVVAGCGLLSRTTLLDAGYDPEDVAGFAIEMSLEELAMLKHGNLKADAGAKGQRPLINPA